MLRGAGLSRQKIAALKDIAQKRLEGVIPPARALSRLADEEIIERLTAARGVGRWTVEMYLMFTLGRPDVLPIDDLGVRKGAEKLYSRAFTPKELGAYGERWAPWRSARHGTCGASRTRRRRSNRRSKPALLAQEALDLLREHRRLIDHDVMAALLDLHQPRLRRGSERIRENTDRIALAKAALPAGSHRAP